MDNPNRLKFKDFDQHKAFTLLETLVVAALVVLFAAALVPNIFRILNDRRVLYVSLEFSKWLSLIKTFSDRADTPCTVTIEDSGDYDPGKTFASVVSLTGTPCVPPETSGTFVIPRIPGGRFKIIVDVVVADDNPFTYTPRGTTTNTQPIDVYFGARYQDSNYTKCVQIGSILGQIRVGTSSPEGDACTTS